MTLQSEFIPLTIEGLPALAAEKKAEGARFVQMLCVNTEEGIDLVYSFMKDGVLTNHEIKGVKKGTTVPSVTDQFLAAFVFENEAHDLFGVDIEGIAIDFGGNFYALAQKEPMTIISPEQKAAREKARKVAEAKAAKERAAKAAEASYVASHPEAKSKPTGDVIKPSGSDDLDARLAGVDPEKRGSGAFRRLFTPFLEYADEHGLACYLDCYTERLEQLYGHFGFETVERRSIDAFPIEERLMVRRAR